MITACPFLIHIDRRGMREGLIVFNSTDRYVYNLYVDIESIIPQLILVISRKYVYNSRVSFYVNLYSIVGTYVG